MESEFFVPELSILIGRTLGDLEKDYDIVIDHIHIPTKYGLSSERDPRSEHVIKPNLFIQAIGGYDGIRKLRLESIKLRKPYAKS